MKKIILTILLISILAILGWLYFVSKTQTETTDSEQKEGGGFIQNFFPFGGGGGEEDNSNGEDNAPKNNNTFFGNNQPGSLKQVTKEAVAGYATYTNDDESNVRFVNKTIGNVFEVDLETLEENRITNKTIPNVEEALFNDDGNGVVYRYTDQNDAIRSHLVRLDEKIGSSTDDSFQEVRGVFLPNNILSMVVNQNRDGLLYIEQTRFGVTGRAASFDTTSDVVFSSPHREWNIEWPDNETASLTTKAHSTEEGFSYFVSTVNGVFTKILGDTKGLTTNVSSGATHVLYGGYSDDAYTTRMYTSENGISKQLSITTLPEKCVWGNATSTIMLYCAVPTSPLDSGYPEIWYQGKVSFIDEIWEINVEDNIVRMIAAPSDLAREDIDAIDLSLTENNSHLLFKNKKDSTLWSLRLKEKDEEVVEEPS